MGQAISCPRVFGRPASNRIPTSTTRLRKTRLRTVTIALALFGAGLAGAQDPSPPPTAPNSPAPAAPTPIRIAVLADRGVDQCRKEWSPVLSYLHRCLPQYDFALLPWEHAQFLAAQARHQADLAVVPPVLFATLETKENAIGLVSLVTDRGQTGMPSPLYGAVICRADAPRIQSIKDLPGMRIAGLAPTGLGGWLAAAREMKSVGVDPDHDLAETLFLGTHDAVIRTVLEGRADAGACRADVIAMQIKQGQLATNALRVLPCPQPFGRAAYPVSTRRYPDWAVVSLPHVPAETREEISRALLALSAMEASTLTPDLLGFAQLENYGDIHALLRELHLYPYENYGKMTVEQALRHYGLIGLGALCLVVLTIISLRWTVHIRSRQLEHSEAKYRQMVETACEGIWLLDAEGRTTFTNKRMEDMLGYPQGEMLGMTLFDFMDDAARREAEELMKRRRQGVTEVHDFRFRRKNGSDLWALVSTNPILDAKGAFTGALGMVTDITERKRAEEGLRESEERFKRMINDAPLGIAIVDSLTAQFYLVNPALQRITGRSKEELERIDWVSITHPDDIQPDKDNMAAMLAGRIPGFKMEKRYLHRDGHYLWVSITVAPMYVEDRSKPRHLLMVEDISAQRTLQENLRQAMKMDAVGRLAGGVAHDFNNMLGAILGYTELASDQCGPNEPVRASLRKIADAAERSADLTRQLLTFARKQTVSPKSLDLNATVEEMLKLLRRLIGENIDLVWKPCAGRAIVRMDPAQIDQILANLCVNARDAIRGAGTIVIETARVTVNGRISAQHSYIAHGDYVLLSVSDTGCGMDPETVSHIFEPFFTTKEVGKGTGLGLATVYGAIKQNSGYITAHSEPGKGTIFNIYLPRHANAESSLDGESKPAPAAPGGTETILLVEDEPMLLETATIMIRKLGYEVLSAGTPAAAIDLAAHHSGRIDLLITDVIMPGMNGRELADHLRSLRPKLRRLYMSGYTADVIARHGVLEEGVHFIQKPFAMKSLATTIREALGEG